MCSHRSNYSPKSEVLKYTVPKLHEGKNWYVDFMAFDPATQTMKRKKYMVDSFKKVKDRRAFAKDLIESTHEKLRQGWSPWANIETDRSFTELSAALDLYEKHLEREQKAKTRHSYHSRLNVFRQYIGSRFLKPHYVYQYDTSLISDFLDHLYLDRDVAGRTRNNYRGWCSSLAEFFIERGYLSENPVAKIKTVSEAPKKRKPLTAAMLKTLRSYLAENNQLFLLACMMEYYCFIRPAELVNIRLADISVKEQSVFISKEFSKNKRDGKVGLNDDLVRLMIELNIFNFPDQCYLFGHKLRPGFDKGSSEMFRREWVKMRKALKWSEDYQFYSLKDSGLRDLANEKGIVIARDQARHTDISTTNKYLQGSDLPVHDATKHFKGNL
ncbi:MAG: site-specific integrase [Bacteroidales bacterium]|nr:site-specific integrase [Bacteroidales bacterium]